MKPMKLVEWSNNNWWYCTCIDHTGTPKNQWYAIPRVLGISLEKYVQMLINSGATVRLLSSGMLHYKWAKQGDMRKFKNSINRQLRSVGA